MLEVNHFVVRAGSEGSFLSGTLQAHPCELEVAIHGSYALKKAALTPDPAVVPD